MGFGEDVQKTEYNQRKQAHVSHVQGRHDPILSKDEDQMKQCPLGNREDRVFN